MSATILVTGVAGFIGSEVAAFAKRLGWRVIGLDIVEPDRKTDSNLEFFQCASLGSADLVSVLNDYVPTFCVHCAGSSSVPKSFESPVADFESGPRGTFHLLDNLRRHAPGCRFVFVSSAAVYGNPSKLPVAEDQAAAPLSPYGWHKWLSEQVCNEFAQLFGVPVAIARVFSAYGPRLRRQVIWDLCKKFADGNKVVLEGTGDESRDFIHVSDIARGLITIAEKGMMESSVYNLAAGEEISIRLVAEKIRAEFELFAQPFCFSGNLPKGTPSRWQAEISAIGTLGFKPQVAFSSGLVAYVDWWKTQPGNETAVPIEVSAGT
jgi:UDP-glucose 4-epimerase